MIKVEFSDVALEGLRRYAPADRIEGIKRSIGFFLRDEEAIFKSRPCDAFNDLTLYIYPLAQFRVLYEKTDKIYVWSILPPSEENLAE
jgi:hypothetical protein